MFHPRTKPMTPPSPSPPYYHSRNPRTPSILHCLDETPDVPIHLRGRPRLFPWSARNPMNHEGIMRPPTPAHLPLLSPACHLGQPEPWHTHGTPRICLSILLPILPASLFFGLRPPQGSPPILSSTFPHTLNSHHHFGRWHGFVGARV